MTHTIHANMYDQTEQKYLQSLSQILEKQCHAQEECLLYYKSEDSQFVRFNHSKVRQAGQVTQRECELTLIDQQQQSSTHLTLTADLAIDTALITHEIEVLRSYLSHVPWTSSGLAYQAPTPSQLDDHFYDASTQRHYTLATLAQQSCNTLIEVTSFLSKYQDLDLVGIATGGWVYRGFCTSQGVIHWHARPLYQMNWSTVAYQDRAIKEEWSGFTWQIDALHSVMQKHRRLLDVLQQKTHHVSPGEMKTLLSPSAVASIWQCFMYGGAWSAQAHAEHRSPLQSLKQGTQSLHATLHVTEENGGIAAPFQGLGFTRPTQQILIREGQWGECLVSPQSERRGYGKANGAEAHEMPMNLKMQAGSLASDQALETLGTGIYVSQLWYLNWSNRLQGCFTGCTRFATLWIEDGVPVAPLSVMRFDDCLFELWGDRLEAIEQNLENHVSHSTYDHRHLSSLTTAGILCKGMRYTL
jgi:predicted Zn-dependent protease